MRERTPIDVEQLRRLEPLSALSNERLRELVSLAYVEPLIMGVSVFREGDVDNQTVYLVSGDVQLRSSDGGIDRAVSSRADESRFPLDDSQPRQSSCTTLTNVEIVRVDNSVLDYMMMWDQLAETPVAPQIEVRAETQLETKIATQPEARQAESGKQAQADASPETEIVALDDAPGDSTSGSVDPEAATDTASTLPAANRSSSDAETKPSSSGEATAASIRPTEIANTTAAQEPPSTVSPEPRESPAPLSSSDNEKTIQRTPRTVKSESITPSLETAPGSAPESAPVSEPVATQDPKPAPTATTAGSPKPGRPGEWIRKMHHIMAFKNLPPANVKSLLEKMERVPLKSGETIVQQGELGDYYYVLVDGEAAVTRTIDLAALSPGASFGEESLVSGTERNATVTMKSDGAVMRLSKDDFNDLLREPMINRVSPDEARSQVLMGAIWLDVRHAREYQHGHFRGALNMPLHEMRLRMDELDTNLHYICCCRTGHRSSAAAFLLVQKGFRASVLTGGIQVMPQDLQKGPATAPEES